MEPKRRPIGSTVLPPLAEKEGDPRTATAPRVGRQPGLIRPTEARAGAGYAAIRRVGRQPWLSRPAEGRRCKVSNRPTGNRRYRVSHLSDFSPPRRRLRRARRAGRLLPLTTFADPSSSRGSACLGGLLLLDGFDHGGSLDASAAPCVATRVGRGRCPPGQQARPQPRAMLRA